MGLKTYTVHTLPWSTAGDDAAVLVKEGFAWPAFLFGVFWTLWHGMWRTTIALVLIGLAVAGLGEALRLGPDALTAAQLLVQVGLGLWGNDLRRAALRRRGYVERAVATGRRAVEAEARFFAARAGEPV